LFESGFIVFLTALCGQEVALTQQGAGGVEGLRVGIGDEGVMNERGGDLACGFELLGAREEVLRWVGGPNEAEKEEEGAEGGGREEAVEEVAGHGFFALSLL
jgi:hypothetical protein